MRLFLSRFNAFRASRTARLAGTYLAIIMIMSLGFSLVFYNASSHELGRQIPPDSFFNNLIDNETSNQPGAPPSVNHFFRERADEGRSLLLGRLVLLNTAALLAGGALSYALARRTLQPIEDAMEAQAQFVSDASHELRTPLTAIQTSNEVALRKPKLSTAEARELIEQNTEDVVRLKQLSDGLLNLARQNKTDHLLVPVKLQDIASDAMTAVVSQATDKDVGVHDTVGDTQVLGDSARLVQLLIILLDNAIKYSHAGGTIYLESEIKGKSTYVRVRDEGIGIRASDIPHLFRRFYRADNARTNGEHGGYGLGLAIAEQIVHSQNGTIKVDSVLGEGSTFTVKLLSA